MFADGSKLHSLTEYGYVVLHDIEHKGWVGNGTARVFYGHLLFRYHKTKPKISLHMVKGEFNAPSGATVQKSYTPLQSEPLRVQESNTGAIFPRNEATQRDASTTTTSSTRHGDTSAKDLSHRGSQKDKLRASGYREVNSVRRSRGSEKFEYDGRKIGGWSSTTLDGEPCYICRDEKLWVLKKNVK